MNVYFKNKLKELAEKFQINIDDEEIEKFYDYMNLLLEWNEKMNLTAITEQDDIILKHFIDSMTILEYLGENKKIIDVGTGAGFPGIPIAIMNKDKEITLMDSLNKRISFLEEVCKEIDLENVKTVHSRAEDLGRNTEFREKYDIAVSRAVANLSTLAEYMLPFVKVGGVCICMKGQDVKDEVRNSEVAVEILGGEIENIFEFCLPGTDMGRSIVLIRKIKATSKKYPRKAGMPSKEPLK